MVVYEKKYEETGNTAEPAEQKLECLEKDQEEQKSGSMKKKSFFCVLFFSLWKEEHENLITVGEN